MKKIDFILKNEVFNKSLEEVAFLERDRIFCRHGFDHLLDVARIAWILNLEHGAPYSKEMIYAVGLLHDVGKYLQYTEKIPHHISGARMAEPILSQAGFDADEIRIMVQAIYHHRKPVTEDKKSLDYILYTADKMSRRCYCCPAADRCDWKASQKNMTINY